ncbi:XRE family transcriptional regulator [Prevotella nigrescens]|uniref:XRE family transcriptional regulator n=1 Tax=Prevotella nigrescens TaxID=28133 RepID=UPI0028E8290B|nr:XRE family transcriptional regulator [Prevotella nigrescens]
MTFNSTASHDMGKKGNKRWDSYDEEYVRENLGRLSFEDMGRYLGRSPMSVRLYVLRRKLTTGQLVRRNLLMALLKIKFRHPEDFSPTRMFYRETGIGQRRYWDLYFGRKPITGKEYSAVAEYFGITVTEGIESRQLELFSEEELKDD